MGLKFIFGITAAAIGGIYLTSDEGKKAREAIRKKKSTFEPIIRNLLKDASDLLEGSDKVSSENIRENIRKLTSEAKKLLTKIDLDKTNEFIKDAIKVASKKLREANNDFSVKNIKKRVIKKTKNKSLETTKK